MPPAIINSSFLIFIMLIIHTERVNVKKILSIVRFQKGSGLKISVSPPAP